MLLHTVADVRDLQRQIDHLIDALRSVHDFITSFPTSRIVKNAVNWLLQRVDLIIHRTAIWQPLVDLALAQLLDLFAPPLDPLLITLVEILDLAAVG